MPYCLYRFKDNTEVKIVEGERYSLQKNSSLTISSATKEDVGAYRCEVGKDKFEVTVICKCLLLLLFFKQQLDYSLLSVQFHGPSIEGSQRLNQ